MMKHITLWRVERSFRASTEEVASVLFTKASELNFDVNTEAESASYDSPLYSVRVDWHFSPDEEITRVEAVCNCNWRASALLTAIFPLMTISSLLLAIFASIPVEWFVSSGGLRGPPYGVDPIMVGAVAIAVLGLVSIILLIGLISLFNVPSPTVEVEGLEGTTPHIEGVHLTWVALATLALAPAYVGIVLLFVGNQLVFESTTLVMGATTVTSALCWVLFHRTTTTDETRYQLSNITRIVNTSDSGPENRARLTKAVFTLPREAVHRKIVDFVDNSGSGIDDGTRSGSVSTLRGTKNVLGTRATYEWKIEPREPPDDRFRTGDERPETPPGISVTESVYLGDDFKRTFVTLPASLVVLLLFEQGLLGGLPLVLSYVLTRIALILGLAGAATVIAPQFFFPSLIDGSDSACHLERIRASPAIPVHLLFVSSGIGYVGARMNLAVLFWVGVVTLVGTGIVSTIRYDYFTRLFEESQIAHYLSDPPFNFTSVALLAGVPAFVIVGRILSVSPSTDSIAPVVWPLGNPSHLLLPTLGVSLTLYLGWFDRSHQDKISLFRWSSRKYAEAPVVRWGGTAVAVVTAYGALVWNLVAFQQYAEVLAGADYAVVVLGLTFLPMTYLLVGLLYQIVTVASHVRRSFELSTPADVSGSKRVEPAVRVYDGPPMGVASYADGFREAILVPRSTIDLLEEDELVAVLAHEEAHCSEHNDSMWSLLAPVVSLVLLVPRNVLFTALDFRSREFRADRHAAEKVDPRSLKTALQKLRGARLQNTEDSDIPFATSFVPILPDGKSLRGVLHRYFSFTFGTFAQSSAHPTYHERIDHLETLEDT